MAEQTIIEVQMEGQSRTPLPRAAAALPPDRALRCLGGVGNTAGLLAPVRSEARSQRLPPQGCSCSHASHTPGAQRSCCAPSSRVAFAKGENGVPDNGTFLVRRHLPRHRLSSPFSPAPLLGKV